jgi:hypothetical protein
LSSSADNSTSRLESLLSISPASAKPGKKICFRQYMHKPRDCIAKNEYHVKFRPWMEEKSGSSAVMSSNASSVTLSMYMAGYTFETVFLKSNHKGTCNANYYMYKIVTPCLHIVIHITHWEEINYYLERALLADTNQRAYSRRVHKSLGWTSGSMTWGIRSFEVNNDNE